MRFALYFSTAPAHEALTREHLERLIPVHFSTEEDALHGAHWSFAAVSSPG
jgi:hypothetical protein